jgi:hypothetical protein
MVLTKIHLAVFLLLFFWFFTKKGKDRLSHAAEESPSHLLECRDGWRINTEHKVGRIGFQIALVHSPVSVIQSPIHLTESLKVALCIFHRARKPNHYSLIGTESICAHNFESSSLPTLQCWYLLSGSHWWSLHLESLVESQVKECSLGSGFTSVFSILILWVCGGWETDPLNKPSVSGKVGFICRSPIIQSGTFSTDQPSAIHPVGAHTVGLWFIFCVYHFRYSYSASTLSPPVWCSSSKTQATLVGERLYVPIYHHWSTASSPAGPTLLIFPDTTTKKPSSQLPLAPMWWLTYHNMCNA